MREIVISEDVIRGYNWFVYAKEVLLDCGHSSDRFQAFKEACAAYDKNSTPSWSESEW
ncbi:MAG: hypothetical protein J6V44_08335 [Methanobrevibacter sp.]|nr:hypothetical protein [Methanobrevibacter sp.]